MSSITNMPNVTPYTPSPEAPVASKDKDFYASLLAQLTALTALLTALIAQLASHGDSPASNAVSPAAGTSDITPVAPPASTDNAQMKANKQAQSTSMWNVLREKKLKAEEDGPSFGLTMSIPA